MTKRGLAGELASIVGDEYVHDAPSEIVAYSYDGTFQQRRPDLAVSPADTEQVAAIVQVAARAERPIVARGASSGLAGGTIPERGGIILNLARMDRIVEIDTGNVCAVVEAGVITLQLQEAVEKLGLFYPPDPASSRQSTLGGNVACNSGGPRCLKYGVTRDYVTGLTVVLASGEIVKLGGKLSKNATGPQLLQLLIGSEGTLGIVTEVIVKLLPLPKARVTASAAFPELTQASQAVARIMSSGILPCTLELMDGVTINVVEDFLQAGLPRQAQAMLLLEQDGADEATARTDIETMAAICRELGATSVQVAGNAAERDALWAARRAVSPALGRLRPNKLGEDIVVPKSQVPAMIAEVGEIARRYDLPIPVFGHAGDGNLHPNILFDLRSPEEVRRVELAARDIFRAAMRLGGTLSGEHGIGTLKREFMEEAQGAAVVELGRAIKRVFDPRGLLNPGKLYPTGGGIEGFLANLPVLAGFTP
ncbi:MAG TPA: FAD-linked oxidase C-terminal domain-containing protein, partial [Chloroflexota bacterium]|nr:FAD-linked oxidase C-terminal domain-containing protein [Chloroflexota bacterium]